MMTLDCFERPTAAPLNKGFAGMPRKKAAPKADTGTVVDRVIAEFCEGNMSELARQLTLRTQRYVSRQQVHGWVERGQFPAEWIEDIYTWTKIPVRELLHRNRPRS